MQIRKGDGMNNIILIGFMGSGKTTVAQKLSKKFELGFIDMDIEIVKEAGLSIREMFETEGESYFRDLETNYLEKLQGKKNKVISTGGGIILKEENIKLLHHIGTTVFLQADVPHIMKNIEGDEKRPLLQGGNVKKTVIELLEQREPMYLSAANVIIQTSGKDIESIVNEIVSIL